MTSTGLKLASEWSSLPHLRTHEYDGARPASAMDGMTQSLMTPEKSAGTAWILPGILNHGPLWRVPGR